jgi:ATP-binding protein involved in chromosome partitioning
MPPEITPTHVDAQAGEVVIAWSTGDTHRLDNRVMRGNCPCATCNDIRDAGERVTVDEGVRASKLWLVGGYAIGVVWSDGHDDGIYTFRFLHELGVACEAHRKES